MANINEILARAAALRDETALNSISPERAGSIMYDTLMALNELWLQQGAALVISKIYASVDAMEADTNPVSDISGKPLRPGQIVVIASEDEDNGSVYRYNGTDSPSWSLVGNIGNLEPVDSLDSDSTQLPLAAHQGKVLDDKISQLGQEIVELKGGQITPAMQLEQGSIASATGADISGNNRIRISNFIVADSISITTSGNKVGVYGYKADGTYISYNGWLTESQVIKISGAVKYRLCFAYSNDAVITPNDYSSLNITIKAVFDGTVEEKKQVENITNKIGITASIDYSQLSNGYYSNDLHFNDTDQYKYIRLSANNIDKIHVELLFPYQVHAIMIVNSSNEVIKYYDTSSSDVLFVQDIHSEDLEDAEYLIIQTFSYSSKTYEFILNVSYTKPAIGTVSPQNVILVGKESNYFNFTEISDAIDGIVDDSENNPFVILVYPGTYSPFVMNPARARYISIIGIDKYSTKVVCTSGKYDDATKIKHLYGRVSNLTFISDYSDFASEADYVAWINTSGNNGAYALHIDGTINSISQKLIVDNCILISYCNSTFGIGLHQNEELTINACDIYYKGSDAIATRFFRGAFYCHSYPVSSSEGVAVTNQNLKLVNNRFYCQNNNSLHPTYMAEIEYMSNDQSSCNYEFYHNVFVPDGVTRTKQVNLKVTYGSNPFGSHINDASYGNNVLTLNKTPFEQ